MFTAEYIKETSDKLLAEIANKQKEYEALYNRAKEHHKNVQKERVSAIRASFEGYKVYMLGNKGLLLEKGETHVLLTVDGLKFSPPLNREVISLEVLEEVVKEAKIIQGRFGDTYIKSILSKYAEYRHNSNLEFAFMAYPEIKQQIDELQGQLETAKTIYKKWVETLKTHLPAGYQYKWDANSLVGEPRVLITKDDIAMVAYEYGAKMEFYGKDITMAHEVFNEINDPFAVWLVFYYAQQCEE